MIKFTLRLLLVAAPTLLCSQSKDSSNAGSPEKNALKFNLNADGSKYFQVTFLNQAWLRYNQSNDGTTRFGAKANETFDIGLRRTRVQLFGQVSDRAFVYFQFGQNNFNSTYNYTSNRKIAAFFHDALCEYKLSKGNQLKIGGGLTVMNGLSRFSQPSIGSIMTLDVPVFLQYSVDQIDQFDRRLAVYARGQVSKLDYRFYLSNPFPVNSNGSSPPALGFNSNFVNTTAFSSNGPGVKNQFGTYLAWNFLENEPHTTPYMAGTYLGSKKVWNVAVGAVYQRHATWNLMFDNSGNLDTSYNDLFHLGIETYLDMPLDKEKGTALNFMAGYYNTNYGPNYLRYNGLMNPATASTATNLVQSAAFGNSFPMFGTGSVVYAQFGWLATKKMLGENRGQLMPYISGQFADYSALQNKAMLVYDIGVNWLFSGHRAKLSLDYQNRPTFNRTSTSEIIPGSRKSCVILQYQIFI